MPLIDVNGKKFKNFLAKLYGFGAAVVILGAMFKILHWPGADIMLIAGLSTEAVIFFFSAFEKPAPEYDWTLVYPELAGVEDLDSKNSNALVQQSSSVTQELDMMLKEANIDEELIRSLGEGLRKFGDAASKLNETIDAAAGTQRYNEQITLAAKHMESLNALYAVQLEGTASQMELQNALIEKLGNSIENTEKLSHELNELVTNMAALNKVYGGMLSAMGVSR
ncbi:gliding motility protein GldL [Thermaurantimonas aggregans]|uniref:Gliding motility protein GldL n=1 Tax=Thermaurantimonas aggregans TaxID=2173829 RepID=A0A401XI97_9FLAO|nr:gliding motility protein GldL [Thermaurantimonas aggregans]MCX8149042.1 gliding motility protein GldL [Thermaurantimonas aggregans]GCD76732.1 gliding motility protein GldL [Thermaurantimonas aggregans]